jgi:hypothetical protein
METYTKATERNSSVVGMTGLEACTPLHPPFDLYQ